MPRIVPPALAIVDLMLCDACGLCLPLCPPAAIRLRREGLLVDADVCTGCRKCIDPCPVGALRMIPNELFGIPLLVSTIEA
ncbi:MAG: 4Fe-4S binding protein [Gemmatimonadota bacterium]|nr:4Fe-4S binding protein [Gemmatimonadota bacterium]